MTTKYSSFSVLGVGLILVIGGIIMILDLSLEPLIDWIQARRSKKKPNPSGTYARLEWNANSTLQLQRLAHEHVGVGTWSHGTWSHPVTAPGEKLAMIDTSNEKHALLVRPENWDSEKAPKTSSSASGSWTEEEINKAHASDPKVDPKVRRATTFESLDSVASTKKDIKRIDTFVTLVNDSMSDDECISPDMLKKVKSFEEMQTPVETPVEERRKDNEERRDSDDDKISRAV